MLLPFNHENIILFNNKDLKMILIILDLINEMLFQVILI